MSTSYTTDELRLAAYQYLRDADPSANEMALRDRARRHVATLGRPEVVISTRDRLREQYLGAYANELSQKQTAERRKATQAIAQAHLDSTRAKGYPDHVATAHATAELQRTRPELFANRSAEFREQAYARLRSERPWMLLDLADRAHDTAIGTAGRTAGDATETPAARAPRPWQARRETPAAVAADMAVSVLRSAAAIDIAPGDTTAASRIEGQIRAMMAAGGMTGDAERIARAVAACGPSVRVAKLAAELAALMQTASSRRAPALRKATAAEEEAIFQAAQNATVAQFKGRTVPGDEYVAARTKHIARIRAERGLS